MGAECNSIECQCQPPYKIVNGKCMLAGCSKGEKCPSGAECITIAGGVSYCACPKGYTTKSDGSCEGSYREFLPSSSKPWSPNRNHSRFRYKRVYRRASSVRVRGRVYEPSGIPSVRLPARLRRGSVQRPLLPGSEEVHERQRVQSQREMRPAWRMRLSAAVLHRSPRRKPLQK